MMTMGHWVTLDDDQHVYISDGGKVLATRGKISSAGGGKDRGKALAARSKAAIGKAVGKAGKLSDQAARGRGLILRRKSKEAMERAAGRANAHEKQRVTDERRAKQREDWEKGMRVQEAREASEKAARIKLNRAAGQAKAKQTRDSRQQSPATTRAIEHAKAAGPSLREQAAAKRTTKGTPEERKAALLARAKAALSKHTEKSPDQDLADRLKAMGTKKGLAEAKKIEARWPQHMKEADTLRGRLKPLGHKTLAEQAKEEATTRAKISGSAKGRGTPDRSEKAKRLSVAKANLTAMKKTIESAGVKVSIRSAKRVPNDPLYEIKNAVYDPNQKRVLINPSKAKAGASREKLIGTALHETGHALHQAENAGSFAGRLKYAMTSGNQFPKPEHRAIAAKVSEYAKTNPREFVAETFKGLKSGKTYDSDVMKLYHQLGGPGISAERSAKAAELRIQRKQRTSAKR